MAGQKENIVSFGLTIQPTENVFNTPLQADLIPISTPDNGFDPITGEDPTLTGTLFAAPRQFLGKRGRAGATLPIRGPLGANPPAASAWVPGRIFQGVGFSELLVSTEITGTAAANTDADSIVLAAGASSVDDFYKGMVIRHAGIGSGFRGNSMVRSYDGTSKRARLAETLGAAIAAGSYTVPKQLSYVLGSGLSIPLLSCSVIRHGVRYDYMNCAINSFAINIPVSNSTQQDPPTIEFAMVGVPVTPYDFPAIALPSGILTPPPPAKKGKFAFNGIKIGHQVLRMEFGLETGAPPNQNYDEGEEAYEILSGTKTSTMDLNQTLLSTLNVHNLVDQQVPVPLLSMWGLAAGNNFGLLVPNSYLDPFSPTGRNGFVGLSGGAAPSDIDRAIAFSLFW